MFRRGGERVNIFVDSRTTCSIRSIKRCVCAKAAVHAAWMKAKNLVADVVLG